jgi:uncharacterized LabA/DUF88 family protein
MAERAYAFIDGAAFELSVGKILAEFGCTEEDINWQALTRNAARIYYFDALPTKKEKEQADDFDQKLKEKKIKFAKLRRVENMHVREGLTRPRDGAPNGLSQKGVDIALATEVMIHTFRENMDCARIFANDLDFFPLLDAMTSTKVRTELFYTPGKTPTEFVEAADKAEEIGYYLVYSSLPEKTRQEYQISLLDEAIDQYDFIKTGNNKFGRIEIHRGGMPLQYSLNGKINLLDRYCYLSKSLELLVDHFEIISKSKVVWENN